MDNEDLILAAVIAAGIAGLIVILRIFFFSGGKRHGCAMGRFSYSARHLLTSNENAFFHSLKYLCDERGILISCKCRLEDVVKVEQPDGRRPNRG